MGKKITSSGTISWGEELLDSDFPLPFTIISDSEDAVEAENILKMTMLKNYISIYIF